MIWVCAKALLANSNAIHKAKVFFIIIRYFMCYFNKDSGFLTIYLVF